MSYYDLNSLYRQRSNVITGMSNCRGNISNLESEISRLEKASTSLEGKINDFKSVKNKVFQLNITRNNWIGNEKNKFEDEYEIYKDNIASYINKSVEAREVIDEEKGRLESSLGSAETHLNNLNNSLNTLNHKISIARKG